LIGAEVATAQQVAVTWLRRAIAEGELRPGDRVGQEAVAARIGVSLIPVREALRILESEGLVSYVPRKGYAVTALDLADLEEIYRLRALVERDAVERGVPHATPADADELDQASAACRAAADAGDIAAELAANRSLHFRLYGLAGSDRQLRLIRMLWDSTEAYRALYYTTPGGEAEADAAHEAIIAAVRERDAPACVAALDAHRERALAVLRGVLGGR
jgi:DNA-binding GntR family transcriptional regulator